MNHQLATLVLNAAFHRGEKEVPREFVFQAITKIDAGEVKVERYPMGAPSLKAVYDIAVGLCSKAKTAH